MAREAFNLGHRARIRGVPERWVTQREAMDLLNVSCRTLARWASSGRLPATQPTHHRRYDVAGILEARAQAELAAREVRRVGPSEGWVRITAVAAELRITMNELRKAVRAGELEMRRDGGWRSVNEAQVQAWVESHRLRPRG